MQCGFLGSGLWVVVRFFVQMGVHSIKFRDHHLRASLMFPGQYSVHRPCARTFRLCSSYLVLI